MARIQWRPQRTSGNKTCQRKQTREFASVIFGEAMTNHLERVLRRGPGATSVFMRGRRVAWVRGGREALTSHPFMKTKVPFGSVKRETRDVIKYDNIHMRDEKLTGTKIVYTRKFTLSLNLQIDFVVFKVGRRSTLPTSALRGLLE